MTAYDKWTSTDIAQHSKRDRLPPLADCGYGEHKGEASHGPWKHPAPDHGPDGLGLGYLFLAAVCVLIAASVALVVGV